MTAYLFFVEQTLHKIFNVFWANLWRRIWLFTTFGDFRPERITTALFAIEAVTWAHTNSAEFEQGEQWKLCKWNFIF